MQHAHRDAPSHGACGAAVRANLVEHYQPLARGRAGVLFGKTEVNPKDFAEDVYRAADFKCRLDVGARHNAIEMC